MASYFLVTKLEVEEIYSNIRFTLLLVTVMKCIMCIDAQMFIAADKQTVWEVI